MPRDARAFLWDVQSAAASILDFVAGLDADAFAASDVIQSAGERKFEIIGEAPSQFVKQDPVLGKRIPSS